MPAAEAIVVAADNCFAPLKAPVVCLWAIKSATDDGFMNSEIVIADNATPLIGLRVRRTAEKQRTTQ